MGSHYLFHLFGGEVVAVRSDRSDTNSSGVIMSIFDDGHLGAVYGGEEGSEEAVLAG